VESFAKRSSGVDATALGVDAVIEGVVSDDMSVRRTLTMGLVHLFGFLWMGLTVHDPRFCTGVG